MDKIQVYSYGEEEIEGKKYMHLKQLGDYHFSTPLRSELPAVRIDGFPLDSLEGMAEFLARNMRHNGLLHSKDIMLLPTKEYPELTGTPYMLISKSGWNENSHPIAEFNEIRYLIKKADETEAKKKARRVPPSIMREPRRYRLLPNLG